MRGIAGAIALCIATLAIACSGPEDGGPASIATADAPTAPPPAYTPIPTRVVRLQTPIRGPEVKPTPTPEVLTEGEGYVEVASDEYYNAFPGLARLPDGALLTVYRKGRLHYTDRGWIVSRRSADGGRTWTDELVVAEHPRLDLRDPNVALLADGALIVNYFEYDGDARSTTPDGLKVAHSFDGGMTWGEPVSVGVSSRTATSAPVVPLPNGEILLAYYGSYGGAPSAFVIRSSDGGMRWGQESIIGHGYADGKPYQEPNLLLLEDGRILASLRSDGGVPTIHTSVSKDMGKTWSQPKPAFKGSGTPSLALLDSGRIVSIYRSRIGRNYGLPALRVSSDDGAVWTIDRGETVIDKRDGPMMYATPLQMPDGSIAVVYGMEDGPKRSEIRFRRLAETRE